ncbi:hypothetical protein HDU79_004189 [Rhizoclosmatium sp. JEL0117]|nr:hypothetical protein HDU79_004189 [Rhizoclosmatium sp. JEL0117]
MLGGDTEVHDQSSSLPGSPALPPTVIPRKSIEGTDLVLEEDTRHFSAGADHAMHLEPSIESDTLVPQPFEAEPETTTRVQQDILASMRNVYRMLSLVQEQSSIGSVEKIVIEQNQFQTLCNKLVPGSYKSLAQVDYKALDSASLNLVGIYGNKEMIAQLMFEKGLFDQETLDKLLLSTNDKSKFSENIYWFASGIYLAFTESRTTEGGGAPLSGFAFFWPEDASWDDSANQSVVKNRVAFMRYLTKLTTGQFCLMSPNDVKAIDWTISSSRISHRKSQRYIFEVVQSQKQEERVELGDGFCVSHTMISSGSGIPPQILVGDSNQGFVVFAHIPEFTKSVTKSISVFQLRNHCPPLRIPTNIDTADMKTLLDEGLSSHFPNEYSAYTNRIKDDGNVVKNRVLELRQELEALKPKIDKVVEREFIAAVTPLFHFEDEEGNVEDLTALTGLVLTQDNNTQNFLKSDKDTTLSQSSKVILMEETGADCAMSESSDSDDDMVIVEDDRMKVDQNDSKAGDYATDVTPGIKEDLTADEMLEDGSETQDCPLEVDEIELLKDRMKRINISGLRKNLNLLKETTTVISKIGKSVAKFMSGQQSENKKKQTKGALNRFEISEEDRILLTKALKSEARKDIIVEFKSWCLITLRDLQKSFFEDWLNKKCRTKREELTAICKVTAREHLESLISALNSRMLSPKGQWNVVRVSKYNVTVVEESLEPAALKCSVFSMTLPEHDVLKMKTNLKHIPGPYFSGYSKWNSLSFPAITRFLNQMLLVIADDPEAEKTHIYTVPPGTNRLDSRKSFHRERLGDDYHVSVNEKLGMLAFLTSKMRLVIFKFNEKLTMLSGYGQEHNLALLYGAEIVKVRDGGLCWVSGKDELCIIQESGDCRIFQLATQQFRPAGFAVSDTASNFMSTPDGACLVYRESSFSSSRLVFKYWGSYKEVYHDFPADFDTTAFNISAVGPMHKSFLLSFNFNGKELLSSAVNIFREELDTNFQRVNGGNSADDIVLTAKARSCMLKVWSSIWTQFPILPAFERTPWTGRQTEPFVTIITNASLDQNQCKAYWKNMIDNFKISTQKPAGDSLSRIKLSVARCDEFDYNAFSSVFHAGEWLISLVSLIPIQLAIARDSQFIPLKDGIQTADVIGADFNALVKNLSLGWYESLFAYYSHLPVRVVSSMGEQSVGKSYSLNHLSDTSFASSAMRTTEGVWMTASANSNSLIVCLDFEGVQSVERSVQEDTFLVLFNTAISNLILFRNNFVLARSIQELFTSFQASSSVLDPEKNRPLLFNSYLAVIVRDVVPQDRDGIVQEFRSKIATIIYKEKNNNFISKLFGQKLEIIPWPVIQDSDFYEEFYYLKEILESQEGYKDGIAFLRILKTLMIKLKVADWSSIDSSMIQQRVNWLLNSLPLAFSHGLSELLPEEEPLMNLDTNEPINTKDTGFIFLTDVNGISSQSLRSAINVYEAKHPRHVNEIDWLSGLESFIQELIDERVRTVKDWISANLAAFKPKASDVETLNRKFEEIKIDITGSHDKYSCPGVCALPYDQPHGDDEHMCSDTLACPIECFLCKRACATRDHFHGKANDSIHLCGQEHPCKMKCEDEGICKIEQQPQAVEAQFVGAHSTFTYTKQEQIAVKLLCCKVIPANQISHEGSHVHYADPKDNFHYCDARCPDCLYFCDRPRGHTQALHHTSHGNMIQTQWAFTDETGIVEVKGHKFGSGDGGAPLLCSMVCRDLGRHIHIDYCRHNPKDGGVCENHNNLEHVQDVMSPHPERPKDLITHKLKWERNGFEDPYENDLQEEFKLCDHYCSGPEHRGAAPSFCTEPLFHPPAAYPSPGQIGHISADGHAFACADHFKSAYHIIFVLDQSSSMSHNDRQPLQGTAVTASLNRTHPNRLGAVYSACHSFWTARKANQQPGITRRDAYSVIMFNGTSRVVVENDFTKSPDELLGELQTYYPKYGTNFRHAIENVQQVVLRNQHQDRMPVVIFLSDGEDRCPDVALESLCNAAPQKILLKTIIFGSGGSSLQRMASIADDYYQRAGGDANSCTFHQALTEVNLAETFLGIAQSLSNTRAALFRS